MKRLIAVYGTAQEGTRLNFPWLQSLPRPTTSAALISKRSLTLDDLGAYDPTPKVFEAFLYAEPIMPSYLVTVICHV